MVEHGSHLKRKKETQREQHAARGGGTRDKKRLLSPKRNRKSLGTGPGSRLSTVAAGWRTSRQAEASGKAGTSTGTPAPSAPTSAAISRRPAGPRQVEAPHSALSVVAISTSFGLYLKVALNSIAVLFTEPIFLNGNYITAKGYGFDAQVTFFF